MTVQIEWQNVADEIKRSVPLRQIFGMLGWRTYHGKRADCGLCQGSRRETIAFSDSKGLRHCKRCNQGGDIFTLVELAHGVKFPDALKFVAAEARIQLPAATGTVELARLRREQKKRRQQQEELNDTAEDIADEERALRLECRRQIHRSDAVLTAPGPWSEEQWHLARLAHELLTEYLLPEYALLSFSPIKQRVQYVLAGELERMAIVSALRQKGGVVSGDQHFAEVLTERRELGAT